jgi:hypothetical protein
MERFDVPPAYRGSRRGVRSGAYVLYLVIALVALAVPSAGLAQIQHGYGAAHQGWTVPAGNHVEIQETIEIDAPIRAGTFYTLQFGFTGGGTAYVGLQQGSPGQLQVRFSLWDSTAATAGSGATCSAFSGEGVGRTCVLPYALQADTPYTLRVRRVSTSFSGWWWEASLIPPSGSARVIGRIRAPSGVGYVNSAISWIEYFGLDADDTCECRSLPEVTRAVFRLPRLGASTAGFGGVSEGHCSGGLVTPQRASGTSVIELGVDTSGATEDEEGPIYGPPQCGRDQFCNELGRCEDIPD